MTKQVFLALAVTLLSLNAFAAGVKRAGQPFTDQDLITCARQLGVIGPRERTSCFIVDGLICAKITLQAAAATRMWPPCARVFRPSPREDGAIWFL